MSKKVVVSHTVGEWIKELVRLYAHQSQGSDIGNDKITFKFSCDIGEASQFMSVVEAYGNSILEDGITVVALQYDFIAGKGSVDYIVN